MKIYGHIMERCYSDEPGILKGVFTKEQIDGADDREEFIMEEHEIALVEYSFAHFIPVEKGRVVGDFGWPGFYQCGKEYQGKQGGFRTTLVHVKGCTYDIEEVKT